MKNRHFGKYSRKHIEEIAAAEKFNSGLPSPSKILISSFAILASLSMFYCSLFYIPAYMGSSDVARYFSNLEHEPSLDPKVDKEVVNEVKWYSPYMDLLRLRRGYFKANQVLNVQYLLSEHGTLQLDINRCGGPVIIEIFHCAVVDSISLTQADSKKGDLSLSISKNGFYRISETALDKNGKKLSYSIIWRRR